MAETIQCSGREALRPRTTYPRALLVMIVLTLLATMAVYGPVSPTNHPGAASNGNGDQLVGSTEIAQAQASLERGAGPAQGRPMDCQRANDATGESCGTSTATMTGHRRCHVAHCAAALQPIRGCDDFAADRYVLLFSGSSQNQTWTFANGVWNRLTPTPSPPARVAASMTYDARDGYVLLFGGSAGAQGGYNNSSSYLNNTWSFVHNVWTPLRRVRPTHRTHRVPDMARPSPTTRRMATWCYSEGTLNATS